MSRTKVFINILMVLILITLSGASVSAAPNGQNPSGEESISGEVQDIVIDIDEETGTTTVLVTLIDELGETQTVRLSLETAAELGLVKVDENGEPVLDDNGQPIPNDDMIGQPVEIDPDDVIKDDEEDEETPHPVASALAAFFADILDLDYDAIMDYHEDGMGFGVIAQACWMSYAMEGNATLLGDILEAKKSGDFTSIPITLPDGTTTIAKNWGQFRKAVLNSDKAQKNLGAIMSGRAKWEQEQVTTKANQSQGKGKKDKGPGEEGSGPPAEPPGKSKDKGEASGPPGKGKDKDKSGGPPAGSPGKDKGGGKGKGK
jgi:hypothetical protein